jgi:Uri superfamily endonuclease
MRRDKRHHWHVDHLVAAGRVAGFWGRPGARECDLVRRLLTVRGVEVPAPGFGSSDCRTCAAHLLSLAAGADIDAVLSALPQ